MDKLPINPADIAVIVVLLISALLAYFRGFVHEVLAVLGWIGAIFATIYGYPYVKPYARSLIHVQWAADLAVGVAIFVVTLILLSFVTHGVSRLVKASALNFLDRSLGFLFGLARGAVIVCIAYLGLVWLMPPAEQPVWLRSARSMPLVREGAAALQTLIPANATAAGAKPAGSVRDKTKKTLENQRVFREMLTIEPKAKDTAPPTGYNSGERREMDRLIEGSK